MLILSRRLQEKVVFSEQAIILQVLAIQGDRVRIGIEAPPDVRVVREELLSNPQPPVPEYALTDHSR